MKGLAIFGGILLLLLLLLLSSIRLHISYRQGQAQVSLHYLFLRFRLYPSKKKAASKKKRDKAPKKEEAAQPEGKPKKKKSLSQRLEEIRHLIGSSSKALGRMRRHIIFYKLRGHITISREDAHQTALAYAKFALFLHTLLELVDSIFVLKKHRLTLSPDFTRETSVYDVSFRIRFRPLFAFLTGGEILLALLGKASKNSKKSVSKGGSYESAASHR
ncbi:MAG: hypothetical protein ACOX0K_09620 [Oscillospiraceae bacterium]